MASQPAMSSPRITIGTVPRDPRWSTLLLWVPASVLGAAAGALVAYEIRSWGGSVSGLRYVATIASVGVVAAAQWWILQREQLDAYWWVPGTVAAQLLASILVVPSVLNLFVPTAPFQSFNPSLAEAMIA